MKKIKFDTALLFLLPGLAGFFLFFILPFFISIGYAFTESAVGGAFVGFKNYISLFQSKPYLLGLKNTFIFIGISLPLNMILSLTSAMFIRRVKKYQDIFILIFLIPLVIPSGSTVFFWKALFQYNGFLNSLLAAADFAKIKWLDSETTRYVVIFIFIWKNLGYNMVLFLSGLNQIPKEYYEAAAVDGAGSIRSFFSITIPYLLPTFVIVVIMSVINSFKVFKEIYLLTGNYPHESVYMLQHFMNNNFFSLNYQRLTTATSILVLIIAVLSQTLLKIERKVES